MEKHYVVLLALLAFLAIAFFRDSFSGRGEGIPNVTGNESVIYLAYSEACPHCHTLMNYIQSKQTEVRMLATTNGAALKPVLDSYGVDWDFGVPMMFAIAGGEMLALEGFPSESQDIGGYFMGKDFEQQLCQSRGGEPQLENSDYRYCKLPDGFFLGNKNAVDYVLSICESARCASLHVE